MTRPLPPGPSSPRAIQTLRWLRDPLSLLDSVGSRFGDIFTLGLPVGTKGVVLVSNPEAVKEIFALGPDEGHAGKANIVLKPFLGQHSLLVLDGSEHSRQRKMMMPAFHGERMQAYGQAMLDMAHDSVDGWPIGRSFVVHRPMQRITTQVILRTVFGVAAGPQFEELADLLAKTLDAAAWPGLLFPFMQKDLGPMSPWGRWRRLRDRASGILHEEIRQARKDHAHRDDVLAMMVAARDEAGRVLSDDEIHDELITLLVAGHETTATALTWALRWIVPNHELTRRLQDEIASADDDPAKIARLELLDATVKETLRLQPVIPIVGRVLQEPMRVLGWDLPTGTWIAPAIALIHQRSSLYPNPRRFDPDRFVGVRPAPWEWLPFGGGLRRCIGAAFAIYEMKMVLAAVLSRVEMRLESNDVRTVRRSITLAPDGGLPLVALERRPRKISLRAA